MPLAQRADRSNRKADIAVRRSRTSTTAVQSLPVPLQHAVPACAQRCLSNYIAGQYDCPEGSVTCLCEHYSSQGYTLGDLAYICLRQECSDTSHKEALSLYNLCDSDPAAVKPTDSVLTPPATTPSKTSATTAARTTPVVTRTNRPANTANRSKTSGSDPTGVQSTPDNTGPAIPQSHQLDAAQSAGIAVGVVALVALAAAAIYFLVWSRRRTSADYSDRTQTTPTSHGPPRISPLLTARPADSGRKIDRDTLRCWQQLATAPSQPSEVRPRDMWTSHTRQSSTQSTARLLPDSNYVFPMIRPSTVRSNSDDAAAMPLDQEERGARDESAMRVGLPPNPRAVQYSPGQSTTSRQQTPPRAHDKSLSASRKIPLSLQIPAATAKTSTLPALIPPPPPSQKPPMTALQQQPQSVYMEASNGTTGLSRSRDSSGSLLNYYASSDAGLGPFPDLPRTPAYAQREVEVQQPAIPQILINSKPQKPGTAVKRDSAASDTSFESIDDDEPSPPEDKMLTPVQESPYKVQMSPIADIRYPKIPRSANQAVPRSPAYAVPPPRSGLEAERQSTSRDLKSRQYQDWPLPGIVGEDQKISANRKQGQPTLAAKRRGNGAAHGLELRLNDRSKVESQASATQAATRGKGSYSYRGNNSVARTARPRSRYYSGEGEYQPRISSRYGESEGPLRSPDPTLTPQRRGNDLYLQVGLASPMEANFSK